MAAAFLYSASNAAIGLMGDILTMTHHLGAAIFVDGDGSSPQFDRSRSVFDTNSGPATVGPEQDVTGTSLEGPC